VFPIFPAVIFNIAGVKKENFFFATTKDVKTFFVYRFRLF